MLKHKDGYVLKPLLKPVHAKTEIEFYEGLATAPYVNLSPFVPKFYGTANVSLECYSKDYLPLDSHNYLVLTV